MRDRAELGKLPQPDYYKRNTKKNDEVQGALDGLVGKARAKLATFLPAEIDPTNNEAIEEFIKQLRAKVNDKEAQKQLKVAEDLLKINQLKAISIPGEHGAPDTSYCILAEAAGGVTEKVSLVRWSKVQEQLNNLVTTEMATIDDYVKPEQYTRYKLCTEAILKLPKHGDIREVQREAMALNISRILGLSTTQSSIMTHGGQPALFVPFDNIRLLSEFAQGKEFHALGTSKTYQHYSTINPVGAGLQGDCFVEDFGAALGLLYVCSDTDSIGGYNQNKALKDNRSLFIFDQVVMGTDKLKLDSRLSLQPSEFIMAHTRHGQGRNRTLIEDSSLKAKFESLLTLLNRQKEIYNYIKHTVEAHQREIDEIDRALKEPHHSKEEINKLKEKRGQLVILQEDALKLEGVITARINQIETILPRRSSDLGNDDILQALILEKLLHNPTLFTDSGRPYKNPWTYRHSNPVKTVEKGSNKTIIVTFTNKVSPEMVSFLKRRGLNSLELKANQLIMSVADFKKLNENMLHPETNLHMKHSQRYLEKEDLMQISKAYGNGHRTRIMRLVDDYHRYMNSDGYTEEEKLREINNAEKRLQYYIDTAKDKGFGKHVMKKMQFDVQQQLQKMMRKKPDNIDEAFAAALKLDQVALFNKVVAVAIKNGRLEDAEFRNFLALCIERGRAPNYEQARQGSLAISEAGRPFLALSPAVVLPDPISVEELDNVGILTRCKRALATARESLKALFNSTATVSTKHDVGEVDENPISPTPRM